MAAEGSNLLQKCVAEALNQDQDSEGGSKTYLPRDPTTLCTLPFFLSLSASRGLPLIIAWGGSDWKMAVNVAVVANPTTDSYL